MNMLMILLSLIRSSSRLRTSIKALTASGKEAFSRLPRLSKTDNAIGSSLEAINASGSKMIKKIYQSPNAKS